jgi:uncharacterized Fe-S cluster-containing radical SAM superfamily protein
VGTIDTDAYSLRLRERAIDPLRKKILLTNFRGTAQESDLSEPANCEGYGRVRHFSRQSNSAWPANPLPIDPAAAALGLGRIDALRAQVFQNAACNWRCWYCFVPFPLLSANERYASWIDAETLIDLFAALPSRSPMIDLTGGQPDLVPEWVPWTLDALADRGIDHSVYVWSDDNLSNDYFWRYLSDSQIELLANSSRYGRVCCFKGFDSSSFSFNTNAAPDLFDRQFHLFDHLMTTGIDLYAYATFTSPTTEGIADSMRRFVDRLQSISPDLPLRTVPLEIVVWSPVHSRLNEVRLSALQNQWHAIEAWNNELTDRFSRSQRDRPINEIQLRR